MFNNSVSWRGGGENVTTTCSTTLSDGGVGGGENVTTCSTTLSAERVEGGGGRECNNMFNNSVSWKGGGENAITCSTTRSAGRVGERM